VKTSSIRATKYNVRLKLDRNHPDPAGIEMLIRPAVVMIAIEKYVRLRSIESTGSNSLGGMFEDE
jgi:hypothetical protein